MKKLLIVALPILVVGVATIGACSRTMSAGPGHAAERWRSRATSVPRTPRAR